jgi:hypothetical protein
MAGPIAEHNMSYDALAAIITKYGHRIKYIKTENNTIAVNQMIDGQPSFSTDDISKETYSGYDFIKIKTYDPYFRKPYYSLIRMNDIRTVVIADNETDVIDAFRC